MKRVVVNNALNLFNNILTETFNKHMALLLTLLRLMYFFEKLKKKF